ncbi:MAG: CinA family protein [Rhodoluna sp.]|nr:CinA family protein [Rhodoluna sp.]
MSAAKVLEALEARGWSLAIAESLTGGLLADAFVSVPGASKVLRGSVVAYATELKQELLGVDAELLAAKGAVDEEVAFEMAVGVANRLGADVAISATGVAGPDAQDGKPVGTVFVGFVTPELSDVVELKLAGTRDEIRKATVEAAVRGLLIVLTGNSQ